MHRLSQHVLLVVLIGLVVTASAVQDKRARHRRKHASHAKEPRFNPNFAMGVPGVPPMPMAMPGVPGMGAPPFPGMMPPPGVALPNQPPASGEMRFQQVSTHAKAKTHSKAKVTGPNQKDLVTSVYNLLSKNRDSNMEDTTKLQQEKEQNKRLRSELMRRGNKLKERALILERLQDCLLQEGTKAKNRTAAVAKKEQQVNDTAKANEIALRKIAQANFELDQRKKALDAREKDLSARENKLKELIDAFRKQQLDFERRVDSHNAKLQMAKLQAQAQQGKSASRTVRKVKIVKVPKIVYKPTPHGCEAISDCNTCTAKAECGWCGAKRKCITSYNGTTSQCDAASWSYHFCKMHTCLQHVHCPSCMADPRCGMCVSTGNCLKGTLTGPAQGSCPEWNYAIDLRFMSYNIYGRDLRNCSARAKWIFKMIREGNADFVALQEVEDWFLEELAKERWALDYHISDFGSGHAPGGLLFMSKIPLESVSYYEKTDPGQIEVDQRARMLVVKPKMGSRNLALATTTLDWRKSENRAASLDMIFSVLNKTNDVVLTGDFNFDADSQPETAHLNPAYSDVWTRLNHGQKGYTWDPDENAYARQSDPTSRASRIDRMFVHSGFWQPTKISKIGCPEASPHYGLLAEFGIFSAYC